MKIDARTTVVNAHGWTGVQLATVGEPVFRDVLLRSWQQIAPKRLVASETFSEDYYEPRHWKAA